ncbi:PPC domain-containing protein [Hirschfeldia incana]|nr:PPC domain-containing protein [Hirschfeldia incana]
MDSKETHQQQNRNAAALWGPTSTSQAVHNRPSVGALSLRQPQPQQPHMLDASPYSVATQQPAKRGRGRPRKYAPPDGGEDANSSSGSSPPAKRGRGRPPVSDNKQRRNNNALGGEGEEEESITAHIVNVNAGEDIATKLVAFMNQEPRDVCILSASGAVSTAVLQSNTPLGVVKYEGLYYITDMSGAFLNTESDDDGATVTRTGNLIVSMAGPDFMVVGGCVGGMLVAGSQVQVIVGTFGPEGVKLSAAPANVLSLSGGGGGGPGLPQSQGPLCSSESPEENASTSLGNSTSQPPHHLPLWPGNNPQ